MDTSGFRVSDPDDFEFFWENNQLDVETGFRPGIDTLFSPTAFDDLEMGSSTKNPILLDEEEAQENSPPTAPVSEKPTKPPALQRSRPVETRIENVPDVVF